MPDVAPVLIDGAWVPARARATRDIRNPATLDLLGVAADCGPEDVAAAVEAAARAQPAWWRVPGVEKAGLLRAVAAKIRADERELSTLMARETGKPLIEAVDCIEWVAACFDYYAEVGRRSYGHLDPAGRARTRSTSRSRSRSASSRRSCRSTSRCCSWRGRWRRRWPPGTRSSASRRTRTRSRACGWPGASTACRPAWSTCVTGGPETGEALVRHPGVDLIAFTGSVAAGRRIAAQAGQDLKKVNLELGSVDPFIVFEDADLDVAVPGVAWARLLNAGQVCTSPKRVYLVEPIAEEFTRRLEAYVRTLRVGDPMDPARRRRPADLRRGARHGRAADRAGGRRKARGSCWAAAACSPAGSAGHFLEPTILTGRPPRIAARRPRRSSARCSRSPSPATRTRPSRWPTTAGTGSARRSTPATSRRPCGRCRRSRRARSGSTIRSPTTTRGRSAACAGAGSGGSWARRGSTRSASRSTCTWTT